MDVLFCPPVYPFRLISCAMLSQATTDIRRLFVSFYPPLLIQPFSVVMVGSWSCSIRESTHQGNTTLAVRNNAYDHVYDILSGEQAS